MIKISPTEKILWSGLSWILSQVSETETVQPLRAQQGENKSSFKAIPGLSSGYYYLDMSESLPTATVNTLYGIAWITATLYSALPSRDILS